MTTTLGETMGRRPIDLLDLHIGMRLRALRNERGLSLETVGEIIGVSQQQVSRFELGQHRLSAAQLFRLAQGLDVPISWFFRGYRESDEELERLSIVLKETRGDWQVDTRSEQENALVKAWRALPKEKQRQALIALLETFAGRE